LVNCSKGLSQDIDYEKFKGDAVLVNIDIEGVYSFKWWNMPDISEEKKDRNKTTINRFENSDYVPGATPLLTKLYHAKTKKDLLDYITDKRLLKQFKLKKAKDYTKNYYMYEYQLIVPSSQGKVVILKYSEYKNGRKIGEYTSQVGKNANEYKGYKAVYLEELEDIEYIVASLNGASFQAIYQRSTSDDEDINRLRQKVRTPKPDNRLNLTTLAAVLKEVEQNDPQLWKKLTK
jgi:hypothetical protein